MSEKHQYTTAQTKLLSIWGTTGAVLAMLSVAMGAFAAHGLKNVLNEYQLSIVDTAATYQMYHALGILLITALCIHLQKLAVSCKPILWVMLLGIVLFSGSLYGLAFTGVKYFAYLTPLGGLCLLIAWLWFAISCYSVRKP